MRPGPHPGWQPSPPPPRRRNPALIGLAVLAAAVVVLIGLVFALGEDKPTPASKPVAEPSASSPPPSIVSAIPKPDAQQTEDLLYGLRQIDRELDRARSIDRARNSCSDLLQGKGRGQVVENTRLRFDGVAEIDTADARAIVKLIEDGGWCKAA